MNNVMCMGFTLKSNRVVYTTFFDVVEKRYIAMYVLIFLIKRQF